MSEAVDRLVSLLRGCAGHLGRRVPDDFAAAIERRTTEAEATLIAHGLDTGLLRIDGNYVRTADPHQGTAWLVEGDPVHPCWEYLPHLAAYVELVLVAGTDPALIRFETPDSEFNLDLAVVTPSGRTVLLGEAKAKSEQLDSLLRFLPEYESADPGKPATVRRGGPAGSRREAWKLAHQLWALRPAFLWLVAPDDRRVFDAQVSEGRMIVRPHPGPVTTCELPRKVGHGETPRIRVSG